MHLLDLPPPDLPERAARGAAALAIAALACQLLGAPATFAGPEGAWRFMPHLPGTDLNGVTATMAFDAARDRVVLAGGQDGGGPGTAVWVLPTSGPGGWTLLPSEGGPASLGFAVSICFDPVQGRLLVWDSDASMLWTVTLDEAAHWAGRPVPGPGPHSTSPACAFDAARSRMLVFGGYNAADYVHAQVWSLVVDDTSTWQQLLPSGGGPTGRMNAVAVVDPAADRLIVSGGRDFTGPMTPRGDVWELSLAGEPAWTALFTADTSANLRWYGHAAVLDTARRRLLVFGGQGSGSGPDYIHAEVSAFDLDGPHQWTVAVPPDPARGGIVPVTFAAYDGEHDAVLEYGERTGDYDYTTRRLALSPSPSWAPRAPAQPWPPPRFGQATAYDPLRGRWLSFGGRFTYYVHYELPTVTYDDLRSFRPEPSPDWSDVPVAGAKPPARQYGQMLYDGTIDRMVLFGGNVTTGISWPLHKQGTPSFFGDTWLLDPADPPAWTPLPIAGPGARDGHLMVLDSQRHRVLLFGGGDDFGPKNDVWALSLEGPPAWTALAPGGAPPPPRRQAIGAYDPVADRLVVAGGWSGAAALADAWELRFGEAPLEWRPLLVSGTPPATGEYARPCVFDAARRRVLVFGTGEEAAYPAPPEAVWALSLEGPPAWSALSPPGGGMVARYGASAAMDAAGDRIAFFGGTQGPDASYCRGDHWLLSFADSIVPALVSLVSADATPGRVALAWWCADALALAQVERRGEASAWQAIGEPEAGGDGALRFDDTDVTAGSRYAYRLRWSEGGQSFTTPETWVEVPAGARFALEAPAPNPAVADGLVSFELPSSARATLDVFDVGGRRVESRDVTGLGAGRHVVRIGRALAPGLYLVRLSQDTERATRRWCVVR